MFEQVILHALEGELEGQDLVLEDETNYTFGRSRGCSFSLPDACSMISRVHCRIKVSSPHVRIQDLGSLNGTYVNGKKIGQRGKEQNFEEALRADHPEHFLWDGDELRIGLHLFRVEFVPPFPYASTEARDPEKLWSGGCPVCN